MTENSAARDPGLVVESLTNRKWLKNRISFSEFCTYSKCYFLVARKTRVIFRLGEKIVGNGSVATKKKTHPKQRVKRSEGKKVKKRPGIGD